MSQPDEVARVRKLAFAVLRRGTLVSTCVGIIVGGWVVSAPLLHKGLGRAIGARLGPSGYQVRGEVDWMNVVSTEFSPFYQWWLVSPLRLLCHAAYPLSHCRSSIVRCAADQVGTLALLVGLTKATSAPDLLSDWETI
ncbi:hypothetical protein GW17_00061532 [Ensete ventricosum]|nr:hypothetical protein GW17_00061532 [Ensete ventricosum]